MAQAGNPYQEDPSAVDESGGGKASNFLNKLKGKTVEHVGKLKTKIQERQGKTDSSNTLGETGGIGDNEDDTNETVNNFGTGATDQPKQEDQTPAGAGDEDTSGLTEDFQGLSTNEKPAADGAEAMDATPAPESEGTDSDLTQTSDKPITDTVQDNVTSATNQTKEAVGLGGVGGGDDSSEQQSGQDATSEVANEEPQQGVDQAGKTWTQWATEKVGIAKTTAAANAPTTADGTPIHEKAYDTAVGAKDSAYDTAVGAKDNAAANAPTTADGTPIHQKAYDTAVGAKDSVASQIPDRSAIPSDPAQQTYFQKAAGGIYGAKDSLFSATQPADHHKALSQQVTETVGNLPATLKSSLFGKGSTSPTTTPGLASGEGAPQEAPGASPQSPGLVSRITGLFGTKKPATDESTPSTETPTSEGTEDVTQDSTQVPQSS